MLSPPIFSGLTSNEICYMCNVYAHHMINHSYQRMGEFSKTVQANLQKEKDIITERLSQIIQMLLPEEEGTITSVKFHTVKYCTINHTYPKIYSYEWNYEGDEEGQPPVIKVIMLLATIVNGGLGCLIREHPQSATCIQLHLHKINMALLRIKTYVLSVTPTIHEVGDQEFAVGMIEFTPLGRGVILQPQNVEN